MTDQEKIEFAVAEAGRIIKDTLNKDILEINYLARLHRLFSAMFSGRATDQQALDFFGWLEVEYADCF